MSKALEGFDRATWTTVARAGMAEFEDRRSRFLAFCDPIESPEEAEALLQGYKQRFPDARHHVFAWQMVYPKQRGRFSDDGEPQGTAGLPVLDVLRKQGIDQASLVVVRYFGGVLLGTGGLVRAYGKSASMALAAAEPIRMQLQVQYKLLAPYDCYDRLRYALDQAKMPQGEAEFAMDVTWQVACLPEEEGRLAELVAAQSADRAVLGRQGLAYAPARSFLPEAPPVLE